MDFFAPEGYTPIPQVQSRAQRHILKRFARTFRTCERDLRIDMRQTRKPRHLQMLTRREIVRAMRALYAAIDAGVFVNASFMSANGRRTFKDTYSESALHLAWWFIAFPWARFVRPSAFRANAGEGFIPVPKTNSKGQLLGPDGKRVRKIESQSTAIVNGKETVLKSLKLGTIAHVHDDYDDDDWRTLLRINGRDHADAMGAIAELIEDQIAECPPKGSKSKSIKKDNPRGRPAGFNPKADAKLYDDWQAARGNGMLKDEFSQERGLVLPDLNRAINRHQQNRRRGKV